MYITGIKFYRLKNGLKCTEVANRVGINRRTYRYWEAGTKFPTAEHFEKLAEIFGCQKEEMYPAMETEELYLLS